MSTAQNRDLNALNQEFRSRLERWLAAVRASGLSVMVLETHRTRARQEYLYAQGRTRPGNVVTWTLDSLHRRGLAADVVPTPGGVISWNVADYQRLHAAAPPEMYGLELIRNASGGVLEWPHLQIQGGYETAARMGIKQDAPQRSVWPLPTKAAPKRALAPVTLIDDAGREVQLQDAQAVYGGVLITRTADGVRLDKRRAKSL